MILKSLLALGLLAGMVQGVQAQSVTGKAFGTYVNVAGVTSQSPVANLPTAAGGMATGQADAFSVAGAVDASQLNAITTGSVDNKKSGAQSTSEVEGVNAAGGAITADIVTAVATSYAGSLGGGGDASGSGFTNLAVNGVPVTDEVAANTRVDLPGIGYVVLNEQITTGNGLTSWGITVNMIHVVLTNALGLQTGEIIIGSASSSVSN
jgi:hypothetical protein